MSDTEISVFVIFATDCERYKDDIMAGLKEGQGCSIRCDFFKRGCRDVMKLSNLERHVSTCGFAPVNCSNEDCEVVINRQDKLHHEAEVCEFR